MARPAGRDHANLRVALAQLRSERDAGGMAGMACALLRFWFARGYLAEGRRWLEEALALVEDAGAHSDPHDERFRPQPAPTFTMPSGSWRPFKAISPGPGGS